MSDRKRSNRRTPQRSSGPGQSHAGNQVAAGRSYGPHFVASPARDASATIRGYFYQVDLTILRWLELQPGQALELERGEDIDLVSEVLLGDDQQMQRRLLEQVKCLKAPLTLRSAGAVSSLAWAIEHRRRNPLIDLLFRYTTTAKVTAESRSALAEGVAGINAWQMLRSQQPPDNAAAMLAGIRAILQDVAKPAELNDTVWQQFQRFIRDEDDAILLRLIGAFEWSPGAPSASELAPQVQQKLVDGKYAPSRQSARRIHEALFVYVCRVLTANESERKRLTVAALREQLAQPLLNKADRQLLTRLTRRLRELEPRVADLERSTAELGHQVQQLTRDHDIRAAVSYTLVTPTLTLPPAVTRLSRRAETVLALTPVVAAHAWTAIHGAAGTGKTQLGRLVAQASGAAVQWIALRDLQLPEACMRLDAAVASLAGPFQGDYAEWYGRLCARLGSGTLLVLDDLPRLEGQDELATRLVQLGAACGATGVRLLSLSAYQAPYSLRTLLDPQAFHETEIPRFSDDEAAELLQHYGAPPELLSARFVRFVAERNHRHPLLLAVRADFLAKHEWIITTSVRAKLFDDIDAPEINAGTLQRLVQTTTDAPARELLYRLSLAGSALPHDDAIALAAVQPIIVRPGEQLLQLTGLWVDQDAQARLLVSPLVRLFGSAEIPAATRHDCHAVLGNRIVHRDQMTVGEVVEAFNHFLAADEYDRAGVLLIVALNTLNDLESDVSGFPLLEIWAATPLHVAMDLGVRLYLRALQVAVRHKRGLTVEYLLNDIDMLLLQVSGKEAWALLALLVYAAVDTPHANRYVLTLLSFKSGILLPDGRPLVFPKLLSPEDLLWTNAFDMHTAEDLDDWLNTIEQLAAPERQAVFSGPRAEAGCVLLPERIVVAEAERGPSEQRWRNILAVLQQCAEHAHRLSLDLLWAGLVRARIFLLYEYRGDLAAAAATATRAMQQAGGDPRIGFMLSECMGRYYAHAKRDAEARVWLRQALDQPTTAFPHAHMSALLYLSKVSGEDRTAAVEYALQALRLAESGNLFPDSAWVQELDEVEAAEGLAVAGFDARQTVDDIVALEQVKALGELGIAYWFAGDPVRTFEQWDRAGSLLVAGKTENDAWKGVFAVFAHASGYFATVALTGKPPDTAPASEGYSLLLRGRFFMSPEQHASDYNAGAEYWLPVQLATFAEAVGKDEAAVDWAATGVTLARRTNKLGTLPTLGQILITQLALTNRFAEALDLSLEAGIILTAGARNPIIDTLYAEFDAHALLGSKPNSAWRQAEEAAAWFGMAPIAIGIGTLMLDDRNSALSAALDVADKCRTIAASAADPQFWSSAARVFEQSFAETSPAIETVRLGDAYQAPGMAALLVVGCVGVSLQPDTPPLVALRAHQMIVGDKRLERFSALNKRLLAPFVLRYWIRRVIQFSLTFGSPGVLLEQLQQVQFMPPSQQAAAVLAAVAFSLDNRL